MESQRPASHSFHEPLGNFANSRRDFHIPTASATKADGKVENQKQVSHFPTAPFSSAPVVSCLSALDTQGRESRSAASRPCADDRYVGVTRHHEMSTTCRIYNGATV